MVNNNNVDLWQANPFLGQAQNNGIQGESMYGNTFSTNTNNMFSDYMNNGTQNNTMTNGLPASYSNTQDFWSMSNPNMWNSVSQGIGAVGALGQTYLGFQQLGQAEDQLDFQKQAFWTNYDQQVADREEASRRRRIAAGTNNQ